MRSVWVWLAAGLICAGCITVSGELSVEPGVVAEREELGEEDNRGLTFLVTGNETSLQLAEVASEDVDGQLAIYGSLTSPAAGEFAEAYVNIDVYDERAVLLGAYSVLARPIFSADRLSFKLQTDVPVESAAGYTLLIYAPE